MQRCAALLIAQTGLWLGLNLAKAEVIAFNLNGGSSLTATAALPELMRSASVATPISGTMTEDLTFGTVGAFGTVATAGRLQSAALNLAPISAVIDLEFLGKVSFSSMILSLNGSGPSNPFTAPPLANGKTRIPLTGSSLSIVGGTATLVGEGFVAGQLGTINFNFQTTPLNMPFPSGAFMDVTVNGSAVTESIPLNLTGTLFTFPLAATLGLSGTLNLSGTRDTGCVLSSLVGDANNDCNVGAADYAIWAATFGQTGTCLPADFDRNGNVGAADYALWAANFGHTCPPGTSGAAGVPEPSALALAFLACLTLTVGLRARRHGR